MPLADRITPQTVLEDIRTGTKPEVLAELAGRAAFLTHLDRMTIFRALLDQEAIVSSGLGLGVAMPHARFADLTRPIALFVRLGHPIDFHALDERPVDILFLLLGPDPATSAYLKLLRSASRALRNPVAREALREHFDAATITSALQCDTLPMPP
jgi:PTS system nitrogen regulatory IIA component